MKRIDDGIFQLVTPFPEFDYADALRYRHDLEAYPRVMRSLPYVLPYLVKSGGDVLLVDAGWNTDEAYDSLCKELKETGTSIADVQEVVITHGHADHAGMAGRLQDDHGISVSIHERELHDEGSIEGTGALPRAEVVAWLQQHGVAIDESEQMIESEVPMRRFIADVRADRKLQGGEEIAVGDMVFEVIWTPGHTPGHICLYEKNRKMLMTGDHVLPVITPNVSLMRTDLGDPLAMYVDSLAKIEDLDVETMLPAHEWEITWFKKRIAEIRAHHEHRLEAMVTAVGDGDATAYDVARRVEWTTGNYDTFPPMMQLAAMGETLAHLEHLVETGALKSLRIDGVMSFARA